MLLLHRAAAAAVAAAAALGVVQETMSEFPQNRPSCFSEEEVAAAAAQRFCLGNKEAHGEEEMLVVVDVDGPRTDAHARSTIALLMCALFLFSSLSNVSNVSRTQVKKKVKNKKKIREEKKEHF